MLVVRIEEWPGGDADQRKPIARIDIANLSQLADVSTYEAVLRDYGNPLSCREFSDTEPPREVIRNHKRADGWLPLIHRAIKQFYYASGALFENPGQNPGPFPPRYAEGGIIEPGPDTPTESNPGFEFLGHGADGSPIMRRASPDISRRWSNGKWKWDDQ